MKTLSVMLNYVISLSSKKRIRKNKVTSSTVPNRLRATRVPYSPLIPTTRDHGTTLRLNGLMEPPLLNHFTPSPKMTQLNALCMPNAMVSSTNLDGRDSDHLHDVVSHSSEK